MQDINKQALTKAVSKEIANQASEIDLNREREMKVSFTLSGEAIIRKGNDYSQVHNFSIDWQKAFMFALNKLNKDTAFTVLREFLQAPEIEITKETKLQVEAITKEIKGANFKNMTGKVTIKGEILQNCDITICENC